MRNALRLSLLFVTLVSGSALARPTVAAYNDPVVINEWHSNLTAAKAAAQAANAPLLVIWGNPSCSYCTRFDAVLDSDECKEYIAGRGLYLVYEKSTGGTPVKEWVGSGDWPLLRVTWWKNGVTFKDSKASGWQRPITFTNFKNTLESYIGSYVYSPVPADTSKDAYDPDNDTAAGAPVLTWGDQSKTESLKLANKSDDPVYTDLEDWFKFAVEEGKTYRVSVPAVDGLSGDAPQIGIYSDAAGSSALAGPVALTAAELEFDAAASGDVYVKIWRPTSNDTNITYTLAYQRFAPGSIEFAQEATSVSETASSVTLTVKRTGGTSGTASVQVSTADSATPGYTATAGEDFNGTPSVTTLTWADADATDRTVTITLIKDVVEWEGSETFGVKLTANGDTVVSGDTEVVTILEADKLTTAAASYNGWVSMDLLDAAVAPSSTKGSIGPSSEIVGTVTLKVSSSGSISGKATFPRRASPYDGSFTLKNAAHQTIVERVATITGDFVSTKGSIPVVFYVNMDSGVVEGVMGADSDNPRGLALFRNDWALADMQRIAALYEGTYTVAFPVLGADWPESGAPSGSGYAVISLTAQGRFRVSGKLGDGTAFSQSGYTFVVPGTEEDDLPTLCLPLFAAPSTYLGGMVSSLLRFGDVNDNGVKDVSDYGSVRSIWTSLNPKAVEVYDADQPGFSVAFDVIGGWYDKALNLQSAYSGWSLFVDELFEPLGYSYTMTTKYRNLAGATVYDRTVEPARAVCWQPSEALPVTPKADGSGFTVPSGDLVREGTDGDGMAVYNYGTAVNPSRLRLSFNRARGLLNGSFSVYYDYISTLDQTVDPEKHTWRHTVKTASYNAILLQESGTFDDSIVAFGYYLYAGKSSYVNDAERTLSYSFKQSAPFGVSKIGLIE